MKILIATNSFPTPKNPTHQIFVKNIYEGLKNEGMEVELVYNPYFNYFKSELAGGNLLTSLIKTVFLLIAYLPFILYRARKFDLIYSHAPVWPGFFMLASQKLHGIKHICYVHGSVNQYVKNRGFLYKTARLTLKNCTSVVTNSRYMSDRLKQEYNLESTIITPGYREPIFFYKPTNRSIDIFFVGSATKQKRIQLLLETIAKYKEFYRVKDMVIKMNFSGGLKKEFMHTARQYNIESMIEFGDKLVEQELANTFRHVKVVVLPSTEETLGLVGIEAIACGAILVGSNSGGIKEYLIDGKNGFLFKDGDVDDLQNAIKKALSQFPEIHIRQPYASESVRNFSLSVAMKQTVTFFKKLHTESTHVK